MKNIFITGGTGTLGRALVKDLVNEYQITIFSRDPLKQKKMKQEFPQCNYVLGDIRDPDGLYRSMVGHDIVIHAAAQKHIPEGEANALETMAINVTGSCNVAAAAIEANVKRVVGISTDKVCYPVNTYGFTKALMERAFLEYNELGLTEFALVRYGNVIGSNGSVVQVWQNQIKNGSLPTITDPEMTRFWLTEQEAVDLVRFALRFTVTGAIIIPDAPACSMEEFANAAGITEWETIGLRPGEKMHEVLWTTEEAPKVAKIDTDGELAKYSIIFPKAINPHREDSYTSDNPASKFVPSEDLL